MAVIQMQVVKKEILGDDDFLTSYFPYISQKNFYISLTCFGSFFFKTEGRETLSVSKLLKKNLRNRKTPSSWCEINSYLKSQFPVVLDALAPFAC